MRISSLTTVFALFTAACSSSTSEPPPPVPSGVLVVGTLAGTDLTASQAKHDQLASGAEGQSRSLGDTGHTVMLGTPLLHTSQNEYLSLDRWSDDKNINGFYSNAQFQQAFGSIFNPPPKPIVYIAQPTWASYGSPDAANANDPYFWVVVRGKLKDPDLAKDQAAHDALVAQAGPQAQQAGDVGHTVYTGRDDVLQYFSIDTWKTSDKIEAFYTNPQFTAGFATVFDGTPTVGVYQSTHWHQW